MENTKDIVPIENNKIALAGQGVMDHLFEMFKSKDYSFDTMANRLNEIYSLEFTSKDVSEFFEGNRQIIEKLSNEKKPLNLIRANLHLDHNEHLVKDIKILDESINKIREDDMLESYVSGKAIGDLIDKKGRLLLRQARMAGDLKNEDKSPKIGNVDKMQVNIYNKVDEKQSELLRDLKKANFKEEKEIVDIKLNPQSKTSGEN